MREVASALAQAGVECTTYTRARPARPAARGDRRAGAPRRPRARRGVRPAEGGAGRRARRSSPPACSPTSSGGPGVDVVHGNYWLSGVVGHRLKHAPRRPAGVDVPHPRPGQGRGRGPRAGVARPGRGRGHRLQRRDLRELPGGGAPVPPALRRPGRADRDRAARGRARLLRSRRPARRPQARSGCPSTGRSCCSSAASSR